MLWSFVLLPFFPSPPAGIAEDGYSLSESGWIRARDRQFYFEVTQLRLDELLLALEIRVCYPLPGTSRK